MWKLWQSAEGNTDLPSPVSLLSLEPRLPPAHIIHHIHQRNHANEHKYPHTTTQIQNAAAAEECRNLQPLPLKVPCPETRRVFVSSSVLYKVPNLSINYLHTKTKSKTTKQRLNQLFAEAIKVPADVGALLQLSVLSASQLSSPLGDYEPKEALKKKKRHWLSRLKFTLQYQK